MEKSQSINMQTSLSRHLFRLDEVAAALRYSVLERRIEEGMYWTLELIDSSEYRLLFETLLEVWLSAIGCARLGFLFDFSKLMDRLAEPSGELSEGLLRLSYNLLRVPKDCRDGSVLAIAILNLEDCRNENESDNLTNAMAALTLTSKQLKSYLQTGSNPNVAIREWLKCNELVNQLPVINLARRAAQSSCRILKNYKKTYGWNYLWVCLETLIICMNDGFYNEAIRIAVDVSIGIEMRKEIEGWIALTGRRGRRIYGIPKWCLKWCTARGRSTYKPMNLEELREPWNAMGGCTYWAQKAAEFGCVRIGNTISPHASEDDAWEGFTEFAFPDDIPDEWSLADQLKSHGEGWVAPGYSPSLSNWFRGWFPENSWAAPNAHSKINKILEKAPIYEGVIWFDDYISCVAATTHIKQP